VEKIHSPAARTRKNHKGRGERFSREVGGSGLPELRVSRGSLSGPEEVTEN